MMPLGSQNSGGRSSNLSPLAPPFTLDKPYPPLSYTEQPYGPRFDCPSPVWSPSVNSTFGPNFTENSSKDVNFPPLGVHGFSGSKPNNSSSSSTRLTPQKSVASNGYDGFSYGQYSNSVPTSLVEVKPYYPPYAVADDRELVARKEPSYDLLSNFGVGQLGGSSQVDDTRTASVVKYTPQWSGLWNGLNDVEQGNWLDLGGNYGSKDLPSESSTSQKGMRKVGSIGPYVETSVKPTNCFDGFGGENSFGSATVHDRKSFKESNPGGTTSGCTRMAVPTSGSISSCHEMTHDPFLQHPLSHYGLYEGPVDSRDKHTNYADSYAFDSTSTVRSSTTNMNKMTFGGFPSPQYAAPSTTVDTLSTESMDKIEQTSDFLPYHPFGLNFKVGNYTGKTESLFTGSSSTKLEDNMSKKQVIDDGFSLLLKTVSVCTVPHLSVPDYSMEKFSDGLEVQNPAEDSPCWKGAHFSPFEDSKMVTPDIGLEMSESCPSPNGEEHQDSLTGLDTVDTVHVYGEMNENFSSKRASNSKYVSAEHDGSCFMMQGLQSFDRNHGLDLGMGNELTFLNYSGIASSSKTSQPLQINSEGCEVMPEEKLASLEAETVAELKDLNSKVDISVLVNKMKNLSEVLATHCSNSHDTSTELDCTALKHIISNLNSCLVKNTDQATQTEKPRDLQQASSCLEGAQQDQMVSKVTSARVGQHDFDGFWDWKSDIPSIRNENRLDSSVIKGNIDTRRDAEIIQAIKGALDMNFPSEEMQRETVFYKDLWLEAEAALCANTIRSRFNRMKIETEKRDYQQTSDDENAPIPKASNANKVAEPPHEANGASSTNDDYQSHQTDMESSVIARFQTLRSVVEDSKSTKPVGAHKSPSLDTDAHQIPNVDIEEAFACPQSHTSDIESSVMARLNTLKSRADYTEDMKTEGEKSPSKENTYSYFPVMATHNDDPEDAVLSRFNILKSRMEQSESLDMGTQELQGQANRPMTTLTSFFSTENTFGVNPVGKNVKGCSDASMSSNPGNKLCKVNGFGDELLEGWYDCSEPGWEHVIKESSPKQN